MRVERIGLEHHGDAPTRRRDFVDKLAVNIHLAAGDFLQPGDHAQQGRFSAARRADQDDELPVCDIHRDAVQYLDIAVVLANIVDADRTHSYPLRAGFRQ
jgi:hypothetical protein